MYELSDLGFGPFFEEQITADDVIIGRIAAEHRGGYLVWSDVGEGTARLAGRLARDLAAEAKPGVGDWVTLRSAPEPDQLSVIDGVLERRTVFIRGVAGRQARGQVVAANVDTVFVVCGLDGDYNVRRIERYLARIWASGAQPVIILNKADVGDDVEGRICEVELSAMGVPVLATSALLSTGLDPIKARLERGTTAAFVGSSGAGKSTLVNRLLGEERMATLEVRADDSRGRHATTHRELFVLPEGGLVMDTPGMRELQLFDEGGIDAVFSDIEALSERCRFSDCSHQSEVGCAVRGAVADGEIDLARVEHYLKMVAEAQANELRRDTHRQRKEDRAFSKRIARDTKLIRRTKGR